MTIRALPITILSFLILGIFYLIGSLNLGIGTATSPGAGLYPFFIGVVLICIALPFFLLSLKQKEQPDEEVFPRGKDLKRVVALASTFVFFAVFLKPLGYWVCGTALMGASLRLLGMQSWAKIVSISLLTTAISYFLFVSLLKVPIPLGIFFS